MGLCTAVQYSRALAQWPRDTLWCCVVLRGSACDPCVCMVGMLVAFRVVDIWELVVLAIDRGCNRLSQCR